MIPDLLVTGARTGHPWVIPVLDAWVREYGKPGRLHVCNARGVDLVARKWAGKHSIPCDPFEQPWDDLGIAAGMLCNEWAVNAVPRSGVCFGFPVGESPGTRGCMRLALRKGLLVRCVDRHGEVSPILDPCDVRLGRRLGRRLKHA